MKSQPMRTTQLIFNHGPGSILETVDGPAIVRTLDCLNENEYIREKGFPESYEIHSARLCSQLVPVNNQKVRLHWLPSNAELGKGENFYSIKTNTFPAWMLCNRLDKHGGHGVLFMHGFGNAKPSSCPECDETASAIRFVKYCNDGHLDDINWRYHVCGANPSAKCEESVLQWKEVNSSMQGVTIRCPSCNNETVLSEISQNVGKCTGRHPEKRAEMGTSRPRDCKQKAKITQRQSTILWQSSSQRVISVPTDDKMGELINALMSTQLTTQPDIDAHIETGKILYSAQDSISSLCSRLSFPVPSDDDVKGLLQWMEIVIRGATSLHKHPLLDKLVIQILKSQSTLDFKDKWSRIQAGGSVNSALDSYKHEFEGLVDSSRPNDVKDHDGRSIIFSMEDDPYYGSFGHLKLKGEPIQRLRSVTALTGYSRGALGDLENQNTPKTIDLSHNIHGDDWYAATSAFGEGILITLDEESAPFVESDRWGKWMAEHKMLVEDSLNEQSQPVPWILFRSPRTALMREEEWMPSEHEAPGFFAESHPMFVWWHTFSHHLIRAVQAETGYSSSAISERVYAIPKPDGTWTGAILLYVTEGGMDGTLGGLISLLPNMQIYLDRVRRDAVVCSMDPLCEEGPSRILPEIGCYACTFNPETSCEHRNMFLDRLLMVEGAGI